MASIARNQLKFRKTSQGRAAQLPNGGMIIDLDQQHFAVDISSTKFQRTDPRGDVIAKGANLRDVLPELADDSAVEALRRAGKAWTAARINERLASENGYAAIVAAAAAGVAETRIAKELEVDRMTVRRALGKR
jgi:hypothetical protein